MASSISCGYPLWLDGMTRTASLTRQFGVASAFTDNGTAAASAVYGGVVPGTGANFKVTAPVSGLTVNVAAGYAVIPATTAGQGGYVLGLMSGGSLTVASNATGSTRKDLVVANVSDVGSSASTSSVKYLTGTTSLPSVPANSLVLAEVDVTNGASSITTAMITDKRTFAVARGGVLPISSVAASPAMPGYQFFWDLTNGVLAYTPQSVQRVVLTGSGNWNPPAGVSAVRAQLTASAAGGSQWATGTEWRGGGGAEYAEHPAYAVAFGTPVAYSVPAGGAGGFDAQGADGANATFGTLTAHGGLGNETGGTGSTAPVHYDGGDGGAGVGVSGIGGGGGASGSPFGPGGDGAIGAVGGEGGRALEGGGDGGQGTFGGSAGDGQFPGGGGGGNGYGLGTGGDGADGTIILEFVQVGAAEPYSFGQSADVYAYTPAGSTAGGGSSTVTVTSATVVADGSTDFEIDWFIKSVYVTGSPSTPVLVQAQVLIDGLQADAIDVLATSSGALAPSVSGTYFTSPAARSRMSAGTHTVSLRLHSSGGFFFFFNEPEAASPWWIRVTPA